MQPFWSEIFTALVIDLTVICMPWYVCKTDKHFKSSIMNEITWPLLSIFCHVLGYERNWFVIQENLLSFSLIYCFRHGLAFFWFFPKLLTLRQSKNCSNIWQYLGVLEVSVVPKMLGILSCSFIENRYSHLGMIIKVHVLVSKVW